MLPLENLTGQHGDSVALVFLKYGFNQPVTPENIQLALAQFGDDFAEDLSNAIANDFSVFVGKKGKRQVVRKDENGGKGILKKVGAILKKKKPSSKPAPAQVKLSTPSNTNLSPAQERLLTPPQKADLKDLTADDVSTEEVKKEIITHLQVPKEPETKTIKNEVKNSLKASTSGGGGGFLAALDKGGEIVNDIKDMLLGEDDPEKAAVQQKGKSVWPFVAVFVVVVIIVVVLFLVAKRNPS